MTWPVAFYHCDWDSNLGGYNGRPILFPLHATLDLEEYHLTLNSLTF